MTKLVTLHNTMNISWLSVLNPFQVAKGTLILQILYFSMKNSSPENQATAYAQNLSLLHTHMHALFLQISQSLDISKPS